MSRRRKHNKQAAAKRRERRAQVVDLPPAEAIEAYVEVLEWATENPGKAAELASWDEEIWSGILAGMAFPETFDIAPDELRTAAWQLRAWNILHGFKYTFDWPTPITTMSEDEIIAQVRQDGLDGKIGLASDTNE
jgi:hypothetical protein